MKIKQKRYPYPVLTFFDKTPEEIHFSCQLDLEEMSEYDAIKFKVTYSLKNEILAKLIIQNKAVFGLHLECPSTMKRILLKTNKLVDEFEILLKDINKNVDVNFFILANEDIPNYTNIEVDPYSTGMIFNISKGDTLAIAVPETLEIEKEPLVEANSIFELVPTKMANAKPIEIDLSSEKIRIQLPKEDFDLMKQIHSETFSKADSLLAAIYYTPAVVEALYMIKDIHADDNEAQIDEIRDTTWYKSLKVRLENMSLDIEKLEGNLLGIAHELLENPNKKAMNYILTTLEEEDI